MSDHKAQAEALVASELAGGSFDQTRDYIALAQVHATLYLAEQTRIANLIAYRKRNSPLSDERERFDAQIEEGLGLS